MRHVLVVIVCAIQAVFVQSSLAQVSPTAPETLLRHRIDDESTIVLHWDPSSGFSLELNGASVNDLVTSSTEQALEFRGAFVDDEPTIIGSVTTGAEEDTLVVSVEANGWDVFEAVIDDEGDVVAASVCRCSATGPAGGVCKGKDDCEKNKDCGTGKLCQWRVAVTEPLPL